MARKKQKQKSSLLRIRPDIARIFVVVAVLSAAGFASAAVPPSTPRAAKQTAKHVVSKHAKTMATSKYIPPKITPKPPPATAPAPSAPAPAAPAPHPVTTAGLPTSPPAPVVTPSPASSVDTLKPIPPPAAPATQANPAPSTGPSPAAASPPPATATAYSSTNWSGYFAAKANYTGVAGSWIATSPSSNGSSTSADSTWIGIGGVTSGDLIQVGTQNIVSADGTVTASAFFELLPDYSRPVPGVSVSPGDSMTASITRISGDQWNITITDNTNGQSNSQMVTYSSSLSSVEWIEEDPSYSDNNLIPFDYYGSTRFSNSSAATSSGAASISASGAQPIVLVNNAGQTLSIPSILTVGGGGFTVTRDNTHS